MKEWQALRFAQNPQSWTDFDEVVRRYIIGLIDLFKHKLNDNLVGVYLHGSLATRSYFSPKSDIDRIIVVKRSGDEYVCFVQIGGDDQKDNSWTIWSDDSDSKWFEDYPIIKRLKEIAWENVDICANCGSCGSPGGTLKTIFGKEFNNVCITTFHFNNPDAEALECVKKMVEIRKIEIIGNV